MNFSKIVSSDYFKLFVKREGKVVLGKHYSSLWLLTGVLTATLLAIAFSNASLNYLAFKMDDPFINWVDIKNNYAGNDFDHFEECLSDTTIQSAYGVEGYQTDKYFYVLFTDKKKDSRNLKCRYFASITTPLVQAILSDENVIRNNRVDDTMLNNESYGVIITQDALSNKLKYEGEIPKYIYYRAHTNPEAGEEFGVDIYDDHYAMVPVPVLAVVKRLPTNMDMIGTKFFYLQNFAKAFNMDNASYSASLIYNIPDGMDTEDFAKKLEDITTELTDASFYTLPHKELPKMLGIGRGRFVGLFFDYDDEVDFAVNRQIHERIMNEYQKKGIIRVYEYDELPHKDDTDDYISVHFGNLNEISAFQEFAKEKFNIDIEMSQINAKKNFNEVSIMANILSWTMIVFAIICIILFIVNLLQSYFQKVKRNLGTFKAFGISNLELISIYVLIMVAMILAATALSFTITLLIQEFLPLLGLMKDDSFNYLCLWSPKTAYALAIIIIASVSTVYKVMSALLKATPGDLIYDR